MSGFAVFNPRKVDQEPQYDLGVVCSDGKGNEWIYVHADAAALAAGRAVRVDFSGDGVVAAPRANSGGQRVGVPVVAIAEDHYGWVQWTGEVAGQSNASINAGAPLGIQGGGEFDDALTGGGRLTGAYAIAAAGANAAVRVFLNRAQYNNS